MDIPAIPEFLQARRELVEEKISNLHRDLEKLKKERAELQVKAGEAMSRFKVGDHVNLDRGNRRKGHWVILKITAEMFVDHERPHLKLQYVRADGKPGQKIIEVFESPKIKPVEQDAESL